MWSRVGIWILSLSYQSARKAFRTCVTRHSRNLIRVKRPLPMFSDTKHHFKFNSPIPDWDKRLILDMQILAWRIGLKVHRSGIQALRWRACTIRKIMEIIQRRGTSCNCRQPWRYHRWRNINLLSPFFSVHKVSIFFSSITAKYQLYERPRQCFYHQYIKHYDANDTNTMSTLQLTFMFDWLGSTVTPSTVLSFFTRCDKKAHHDETIIDQAIQCVEAGGQDG